MKIRPASLRDLAEMDQVALQAKAYWGYTSKELARWAKDLRTKPETIGAWPTAYFSPSWTAFQADRGRDFSVIVDGVSN